MKKLIPFVWICILSYPLFSIFLSACSDEGNCSIDGRQMVNCTFQAFNPETEAIGAYILDSLTITAVGTDSIILNNQKNVERVSLPLRFTSDSTLLVFHYTSSLRDTLYFYHNNTPYFLSMECGYEMRQSLRKIEYMISSTLDSISIVENQANTNETENVRIILRR